MEIKIPSGPDARAVKVAAVMVARAHRNGSEDEQVAARQDLAALRAEVALRDILDAAPRLRGEQVERLAGVLREHGEHPGRMRF